jgi:hypothetical protein
MYAQISAHRPQIPADATTATPSRAVLQTRPRIQRAIIRSWEYRRPVRITFLAIRMLVVLWLFFLAVIMASNGIPAGWALVPTAIGVFALSLWIFHTADKGWPVVNA